MPASQANKEDVRVWRLGPDSRWHFELDRYVNRVVPEAPLHRLPPPVSRFLGYRVRPPRPLGNLIRVSFAFVGIFGCLCLISGVGQLIPAFRERGAPIVVGSFVSFSTPVYS
jgi:hypothetical protein